MIGQDGKPMPGDQYGQELILDLYECDLAKISDGEHIRKFLITLCDEVIFMKRYGESWVEHFGHDDPLTSGYSMMQMIETSNVSGHFSEHKRSCYINIFSCKWFDEEKALQFTKDWFGAQRVEKTLIQRI
jgi:S-adenosylmethionine decarboxylase